MAPNIIIFLNSYWELVHTTTTIQYRDAYHLGLADPVQYSCKYRLMNDAFCRETIDR